MPFFADISQKTGNDESLRFHMNQRNKRSAWRFPCSRISLPHPYRMAFVSYFFFAQGGTANSPFAYFGG
jgi:hypothetical protein